MNINNKHYRTVWMEHDIVKMINQPLLPHSFEIYSAKDYQDVANAIKTMIVRGAGAIGATGAYGLAQAALQFKGKDQNEFKAHIEIALNLLQSTRPTAHDLSHGLAKVNKSIQHSKTIEEAKKNAAKTANDYADWSADNCKKIGEYGEKIIKNNSNILTHCNAGWLAFVDYGSALSPIYLANRKGKKVFVYVDETRPRCQGASLTAFELGEENIPHAIIADNAAGFYMKKGEIDLVITGADRIAANGDAANKIGTYEKAVLAKENNIPFYIAAPSSTIDLKCPSGDDIPIEERSQDEVLYVWGWSGKGKPEKVRIAPKHSTAKNPAFDVTPAKYIKGIITEKGIFEPDKINHNF